MTVEKLTRAGEVKIKAVEIVTSKGFTIDVTNQVVDIKIFEDLFSPFLTGQLVILDAIDISSLMPLIGEERLNLNITTPESQVSINQQFYLYKMSDKDKYNDTTSVYRLHFMSLEGAVDANRVISKVFKGKCSDIAKSLFQSEGFQTSKTVNVEPSRNSTSFISNYWSPAQCLSYAMENAENINGVPSYVCFENREGYVFASLDSLYKVDSLGKFVKDNYFRDVSSDGRTRRNILQDYCRILNFNVPELYNYLDRVTQGYYASTMISYDLVTKKYSYRVYDAKNNKVQNLNDQPMSTLGGTYANDAKHIILPKYYGNFNGYSDVTNYGNIQQRLSLLKQAEALKIRVTVLGRVEYTVGRTMDIEVYKDRPVRQDDTPNDAIDMVLSGHYLISAICHNITRDNHICNIELIKDSILKAK
jgi:hypothetical protein